MRDPRSPRLVTSPGLFHLIEWAALPLGDGSEIRVRSLGDRVEVRTWDPTDTCSPAELDVRPVGKHVIDVRPRTMSARGDWAREVAAQYRAQAERERWAVRRKALVAAAEEYEEIGRRMDRVSKKVHRAD